MRNYSGVNQNDIPPSSWQHFELGLARVAARLGETPPQQVMVLRMAKMVAKRLQEDLNRELAAWRLTDASFTVLVVIFSEPEGGINPSSLSNILGESRANITRLTDELEARRLILRRPATADRRRIGLDLTRSGEKLVRELLPAMWRHYGRLCRDLSVAEMRTMERSMKKVLADLDLRPRKPDSAGTQPDAACNKVPR